MSDLSIEEQDLLKRIANKPELQPLFFRKATGKKWFGALYEAGYFDDKKVPEPAPAKQEGYVTIPDWEVTDYLLNTTTELVDDRECLQRLLKIIVGATAHARKHDFGNHRVWWKFSRIISKIPSESVSLEFLDSVDYWFDDKYETSLVANEIGTIWLVKLLEEEGSHSLELATKLLEILYKVKFEEQQIGYATQKATLRFKRYHTEEITKRVALLAGRKLGKQAVSIFHSRLVETVEVVAVNTPSVYWQPAIEEHEQNKHRDDLENILVKGYRDCLSGYIEECPEEACDYLGEMLQSSCDVVQRLAIHCITERFTICNGYTKQLLSSSYLNWEYRYEFWHFVNRHYSQFEQEDKDKVIELVKDIKRYDEDNHLREEATAYQQAGLLAAIKNVGEREKNLYNAAVLLAKAEPDHPDFAIYMTSGSVEPKSPYSVEVLRALPIEELTHRLADYSSGNLEQEEELEGLAATLKQLIKEDESLRYCFSLSEFIGIDPAYICSVIDAYAELWNEKANRPWDEIWICLLGFCRGVVDADEFWSEENACPRGNRRRIIIAIGRLLEDGAKSDAHAFHQRHHSEVESLLAFLLQKQNREKFTESTDAMFVAINSPRGICLEALINLTLRSCRLSDREHRGHVQTWEYFQHYYETELERGETGEYEFLTLMNRYLANFCYMSFTWVKNNLGKIFDQTNNLKWLCAIQGYAYSNPIWEVYRYLSEHGDLLKALNHKDTNDFVKERVIQQGILAYFNGIETLTDKTSLVRAVIDRNNLNELNQLIWYLRIIQEEDNSEQRKKVYQLWSLLIDIVDTSTDDGRKLASALCSLVIFVDYLTDDTKSWLLKIAPYADDAHHSYLLLEGLARLSEEQPFDANDIWLKMLERSDEHYPEEAVKQILKNLIACGSEGKRLALNTVSIYIEKGIEGPHKMFEQLLLSQSIKQK